MIGGWTPSSAAVAVSLHHSIISGRQIPQPKQTPHTPSNARIPPLYPFLDLLLPSLLASAAVLPLVPAAVAAAYPCETPTSYYSPADGLKGAALKKRLSSIISPHHSISYKKVWDALKILDAADVDNPEASSQVIEIYSLRSVAKELAGKPKGWNREHLWPRSYGLRDGPSFTDLHNIRPADVNVNSSRGNKYYGECVATSVVCLRPANREAAPDTETDKQRWAPPLQIDMETNRNAYKDGKNMRFCDHGSIVETKPDTQRPYKTPKMCQDVLCTVELKIGRLDVSEPYPHHISKCIYHTYYAYASETKFTMRIHIPYMCVHIRKCTHALSVHACAFGAVDDERLGLLEPLALLGICVINRFSLALLRHAR